MEDSSSTVESSQVFIVFTRERFYKILIMNPVTDLQYFYLRTFFLKKAKTNQLRGEKLNYKSVAKEISKPPFFLVPEVQWASKFTVFVQFTFPLIVSKCFYSLLKSYNFRNIVHFLKRILQVVDNAMFWQNALLYFENDPLSASF